MTFIAIHVFFLRFHFYAKHSGETSKLQEIIIMGYLNAKVEKENSEIISIYGLGLCNEHTGKWFYWCSVNDKVITNTQFKGYSRCLQTWIWHKKKIESVKV